MKIKCHSNAVVVIFLFLGKIFFIFGIDKRGAQDIYFITQVINHLTKGVKNETNIG